MLPERRTEELRKARWSAPAVRYFVTCCARRPEVRLTEAVSGHAVGEVLNLQVASADFRLLCATIMPDHVHLLIALGDHLSLSQTIGKFKAVTARALRAQGVCWQANFFERRLRPEDVVDPFALYIFMNPYRAGLLTLRETWPWWVRGDGMDFDFRSLLDEGLFPPAVWLKPTPGEQGLGCEAFGSE